MRNLKNQFQSFKQTCVCPMEVCNIIKFNGFMYGLFVNSFPAITWQKEESSLQEKYNHEFSIYEFYDTPTEKTIASF